MPARKRACTPGPNGPAGLILPDALITDDVQYFGVPYFNPFRALEEMMREEDQTSHVHRGLTALSKQLNLSELNDSVREDPCTISSPCGGKTCPGFCASSPGRANVQITPRKILDT